MLNDMYEVDHEWYWLGNYLARFGPLICESNIASGECSQTQISDLWVRIIYICFVHSKYILSDFLLLSWFFAKYIL
jgi:hypothetical protein